ncbi:DUF2971 domain-containing protein [Geotalea toluenoxydans]|uniref:DUF2971 domain-containing protein n=1 Tax=Geotalea toluenoxydans TaxID=421624 RepID=UPI001FB2E419|nr:DUF2971 domain-containing protein [Geotalea toluenoxydans]
MKKMSPANIGFELMDRVNKCLGILSLSRTFTNLLMWSHYANNHTGFVIGFDDSHEFFYQETYQGLSSRPNNVNYTSQRSMTCVGDHDYYEKLLCEKSIDWAYEEEVRIFRLFTDETKIAGVDPAGHPVFLVNLPKDALKSIYLGAHTDESLRRKIFAAINKNGLKVELYDMRMSKLRYELEWLSVVQD